MLEGAVAALAGLLFVALSIKIDVIRLARIRQRLKGQGRR
jgi:hypothetical protein